MTRFYFDEPDGTLLSQVDSRFGLNPTWLETSTSLIQATASPSAGTFRNAIFRNGQSPYQRSIGIYPPMTDSTHNPFRALTLNVSGALDASDTDGYEIRQNAPSGYMSFYKASTYLTDTSGASQPPWTTANVLVEIRHDPGHIFRLFINGVELIGSGFPYTDSTNPIITGNPGFTLCPDPAFAGGSDLTMASFEYWSDGEIELLPRVAKRRRGSQNSGMSFGLNTAEWY